MKSIVILGSTGSIGTNTLDIVERFPEEFRVVGLTAGNNDEMLAEQIRRFHPPAVAMSTESCARLAAVTDPMNGLSLRRRWADTMSR